MFRCLLGSVVRFRMVLRMGVFESVRAMEESWESCDPGPRRLKPVFPWIFSWTSGVSTNWTPLIGYETSRGTLPTEKRKMLAQREGQTRINPATEGERRSWWIQNLKLYFWDGLWNAKTGESFKEQSKRLEGNGTGAVDGLWRNYEMES